MMNHSAPSTPPASAPPEPITTSCPRPVARPVMLQEWHDLASLHWPYEPAVVEAQLPRGLRVDTYGGVAWVGLIPFHMQRIRLPRGPALRGWSTFPETNVRTYVVAPDGRRAVWFFSLDVTSLVPAVVARTAYGLPYCWSAMSINRPTPDTVEYATTRRWPHGGATSRVRIGIGEPVERPDGLEQFVTARWALASDLLGSGMWADVDHAPWPLHRAELLHCDDWLMAAAGLPEPVGDPLVLWSPGVEVRVGRPRRRPQQSAAAMSAAPVERAPSRAARMRASLPSPAAHEEQGTDDAA